jgi:hypothetical protein
MFKLRNLLTSSVRLSRIHQRRERRASLPTPARTDLVPEGINISARMVGIGKKVKEEALRRNTTIQTYRLLARPDIFVEDLGAFHADEI